MQAGRQAYICSWTRRRRTTCRWRSWCSRWRRCPSRSPLHTSGTTTRRNRTQTGRPDSSCTCGPHKGCRRCMYRASTLGKRPGEAPRAPPPTVSLGTVRSASRAHALQRGRTTARAGVRIARAVGSLPPQSIRARAVAAAARVCVVTASVRKCDGSRDRCKPRTAHGTTSYLRAAACVPAGRALLSRSASRATSTHMAAAARARAMVCVSVARPSARRRRAATYDHCCGVSAAALSQRSIVRIPPIGPQVYAARSSALSRRRHS